MHNASDAVHFGLIERLPRGKTVEDSEREVVPVFQDAMDLVAEGDREAGFGRLEGLPTWYEDVEFNGGPGLLSPGRTVEATMQLEPGTYAIECYVKDADGVFHTTKGMISGFTVTEEDSGAPEPVSSVAVTVSSERGFEVSGQCEPGRQTIAVFFEDQTAHGNGLGHDLHIGQIRSIRGPQDRRDWDPERSGTGVEEDFARRDRMAAWVNWVTALDGAAPVTFYGGVQDMPAGSVAYVTVDLDGGMYALVAEVDDPAAKGLLQLFGAVAVN